MTRAELIQAIHQTQPTVAKAHVSRVLDALEALATEALLRKKDLILPGIGRLRAKSSPARMGRNPRTGEPTPIPARERVEFSAAAALKRAINPADA